jgi:hypothetical protein
MGITKHHLSQPTFFFSSLNDYYTSFTSMTGPRLNKIPEEIQLDIIYYLSIQSLIRLYKTSRYWKHRIGNDKCIWRRVYEREFGHEFAKDRWILWAVRRLWSQSILEEKRQTARYVNLTTLKYLDAYTWYRLVRGRVLTERNWRNNTPQRSIIFDQDKLDVLISKLHTQSGLSYGLPFISQKDNRVSFAVIDDTLNNTQSDKSSLAGCKLNVVSGRVASLGQISGRIYFSYNTSEEFIVAIRTMPESFLFPRIETRAVLVWDVGHLMIHNVDGQHCCVPRLCATELLPDNDYWPIAQQCGWLLMVNEDVYIDNHTKDQYWQCILYDIRRSCVAASFMVREGIYPIISKATPDKVQLYYGHATPIPNVTTIFEDEDRQPCQYHWSIIEISALLDTSNVTTDLSWYDQVPTRKTLAKVQEKYHTIEEDTREQGHWCDKNYLLKRIEANEPIQLPARMGPKIQMHHLIEDLFLISRGSGWYREHDVFMVHSVRQQRVIWSRTALINYKIIPEERAILIYECDNLAQLLDMYTGNVLKSFRIQGCDITLPVIGPLCRASYDGQDILIDVRTGKFVRNLNSDQAVQFLSHPSTKLNMLKFLGPTRIVYINRATKAAWIDEYAQV